MFDWGQRAGHLTRLPVTSSNRGKLVRVGTVARELGVGRRAVVDWVKRGVLAGCRVGNRWYVKRDCPKYRELAEPAPKPQT